MTLRLGGDGAITGCTSLENPDLTVSGLTISGSFDAEKVLVASGTAAAPSYTFSGDTDNGLYYAGTNSIGLSTGGTNAILIDSTGNVGIGTQSPSNLLDVASTVGDGIRIGSAVAGTITRETEGLRITGASTTKAISFVTAGSEAMRVDTSGRLLVGTSSAVTTVGGSSGGSTVTPEVQIVTSGSDSGLFVNRTEAFAANVYLGSGSNGNAVANDSVLGILHFQGYSAAASTFRSAARILCEVDGEPDTAGDTTDMPGRLVFSTTANGASSPTERMRIDSSGRLLVGKTSSSGALAGCELRDSGIGLFTRASANPLQVRRLTDDGDLVQFYQDSEFIGSVGCDGSDFNISVNEAERMRITSGGNIYFDTADEPNGTTGWGAAFTNESNKRAILKTATNSTTSNTLIAFYNPNGGVGTIKTNGSSTSYNTSSDYRLKENVVPLTGAADRLNQLQVRRFNFIADPDTTVDGFIAHEAQAVVPEAVTGTHDEVDDEGNPAYQGIDQSKLVPLLTAALQEALAEIESLKTRLDAANL